MMELERREQGTPKAVRDASGISGRPGEPSREAAEWGLRQRGSLQRWSGRHGILQGREECQEEQGKGKLSQMPR